MQLSTKHLIAFYPYRTLKEAEHPLTQPVRAPGRDFSCSHFTPHQSEAQSRRAESGTPLPCVPSSQLAGNLTLLAPYSLPTLQDLHPATPFGDEPFGDGQVSARALGAQELRGLRTINKADFSLLSCLRLPVASKSLP